MFELTLPHWPTLDELVAVRYWALGGALVWAGGRLLHWRATRNGEADEHAAKVAEVLGMPEPEERAPTWPQIVREGITAAFLAAVFGLMINGDVAEWAGLSLLAGVLGVFAAFWKLVHRPTAQVPVGEAPRDEPADEASLVRQGTWAAVCVALATLGVSAMSLLD